MNELGQPGEVGLALGTAFDDLSNYTDDLVSERGVLTLVIVPLEARAGAIVACVGPELRASLEVTPVEPPVGHEILRAVLGLLGVQAAVGTRADVRSQDCEPEHHEILYSGKVNESVETYEYEAGLGSENVLVVRPEGLGVLAEPLDHDLVAREHALEDQEGEDEHGGIDDTDHAKNHFGILDSGAGDFELHVVHQHDLLGEHQHGVGVTSRELAERADQVLDVTLDPEQLDIDVLDSVALGEPQVLEGWLAWQFVLLGARQVTLIGLHLEESLQVRGVDVVPGIGRHGVIGLLFVGPVVDLVAPVSLGGGEALWKVRRCHRVLGTDLPVLTLRVLFSKRAVHARALLDHAEPWLSSHARARGFRLGGVDGDVLGVTVLSAQHVLDRGVLAVLGLGHGERGIRLKNGTYLILHIVMLCLEVVDGEDRVLSLVGFLIEVYLVDWGLFGLRGPV